MKKKEEEEANIAINLHNKFLSEDESAWNMCDSAFEKAVVQLMQNRRVYTISSSKKLTSSGEGSHHAGRNMVKHV